MIAGLFFANGVTWQQARSAPHYDCPGTSSGFLSDFNFELTSFDVNIDVKYNEVDFEVMRGFGRAD